MHVLGTFLALTDTVGIVENIPKSCPPPPPPDSPLSSLITGHPSLNVTFCETIPFIFRNKSLSNDHRISKDQISLIFRMFFEYDLRAVV